MPDFKNWRKTGILSSIKKYEKNYNSIFSTKSYWLDYFSLIQVLLGKHETRDFEVIKANDGQLYLGKDNNLEEKNIQEYTTQIELLNQITESYGGIFLYVQIPYKNCELIKELNEYSNDNIERYETEFIKQLQSKFVKTIDLREFADCKMYYKTDHHWTVEAAFNAATRIVRYLENNRYVNLGNIDYLSNLKKNYRPINTKNSLLGSIGVKVGKYFTGKDDFIIYEPVFDTDFSFNHLVGGRSSLNKVGSFSNCFFDFDKLNNRNYMNKYYVLMYGAYYESIIINKKALNQCKVLLITHSYGRAIAPYLSMYFKELRFLDPQKGRYNESYLDYINNFKPDLVICAYDRGWVNN